MADKDTFSLISSIKQKRPDILPEITVTSPPIQQDPPLHIQQKYSNYILLVNRSKHHLTLRKYTRHGNTDAVHACSSYYFI